jgi:hypothetical protein
MGFFGEERQPNAKENVEPEGVFGEDFDKSSGGRSRSA